MPDASTIANVAQAVAVIVGVAFGILQVGQFRAERRTTGAYALMQSLQSPRILRAILLLDRLPDDVPMKTVEALPEEPAVDPSFLPGIWESVGILVCRGEIPVSMVDDFYSGTIHQSWRKLRRYCRNSVARRDGTRGGSGFSGWRSACPNESLRSPRCLRSASTATGGLPSRPSAASRPDARVRDVRSVLAVAVPWAERQAAQIRTRPAGRRSD